MKILGKTFAIVFYNPFHCCQLLWYASANKKIWEFLMQETSLVFLVIGQHLNISHFFLCTCILWTGMWDKWKENLLVWFGINLPRNKLKLSLTNDYCPLFARFPHLLLCPSFHIIQIWWEFLHGIHLLCNIYSLDS